MNIMSKYGRKIFHNDDKKATKRMMCYKKLI